MPFLRQRLRTRPIRSEAGVRIDVCYDQSLYEQDELDAAAIEVERIHSPILLRSGSDDHMWPSAQMAGSIARRLKERGGSAKLSNVVYRDAGHAFLHREFFANTDAKERPTWDFGGTAYADAAAASDAWPQIASLLAPSSA